MRFVQGTPSNFVQIAATRNASYLLAFVSLSSSPQEIHGKTSFDELAPRWFQPLNHKQVRKFTRKTLAKTSLR